MSPRPALPRVPGGAGSRGRAPNRPARPTCEVRPARKMAAAAARAPGRRPPAPPGAPRPRPAPSARRLPRGASPAASALPVPLRRTWPDLVQVLIADTRCEIVRPAADRGQLKRKTKVNPKDAAATGEVLGRFRVGLPLWSGHSVVLEPGRGGVLRPPGRRSRARGRTRLRNSAEDTSRDDAPRPNAPVKGHIVV